MEFPAAGASAPLQVFPNVMPDLAQAMIFNLRLKAMLNMGYFDLSTPFFESMYEMYRLPMPRALQKNIQHDFDQSGHRVYLHPESLERLHDHVAKFITTIRTGNQADVCFCFFCYECAPFWWTFSGIPENGRRIRETLLSSHHI